MFIYESMSRTEKELDIRKDTVTRLFVCGPTVQDSFHLGHARTYIFFDSFAKYLRASGYDVFYLQNVTDIDDKIINRAREENTTFDIISRKYSAEFFRIMKDLKVDSVNFYAFATRHMDDIIAQISKLVEKGFAYETGDGVYFRVGKFPDYGKLSGQDMDSLKSGARVDSTEEKEDPRDFVIWKKMKPGEPHWESPWGKGRPGWHIEDTAITEKYFGPTYDIHGGGTDLVFPHHEAEIAIERSISGADHLSRYWVHSAMININEEKMSKSLHNFITIEDALKDFSPEELRFTLLNVQFRSVVSFSDDMLVEARSNVNSINILYRKLKAAAKDGSQVGREENTFIGELREPLEAGFDLRGFFTRFIALVGKWNNQIELLDENERAQAVGTIEWVNSFTGIIRERGSGENAKGVVELALEIRKRLRDKRDFETSDLIRSSLRDLGIYIEDKGGETTWWQE